MDCQSLLFNSHCDYNIWIMVTLTSVSQEAKSIHFPFPCNNTTCERVESNDNTFYPAQLSTALIR